MTDSQKPDDKKKIDRREFLVGSGAALAAGALAAGVPGTAKAAPKNHLIQNLKDIWFGTAGFALAVRAVCSPVP